MAQMTRGVQVFILLALLALPPRSQPFLLLNKGYKRNNRRVSGETRYQHRRTDLETPTSFETVAAVTSIGATAATGFYVHIPYCRQRCRYCDFAIVPIGSNTTKSSTTSTAQRQTDGFLLMDHNYRMAMIQEIELLHHSTTHRSPTTPIALSSIYFGGGTPSLAPTETIQAVLEAIRKGFPVQPDAEITMEMDPGTFDELHLRQLAALGVNRISLGVQALDDAVLEQIGRVHRLQDILDSLQLIRRIFSENDDSDGVNVSIDLISGLPGVSPAAWADTLEKAVRVLQPNHISIYDLQIEKGTIFGKWYDSDVSLSLPSASLSTMGLLLPSPDECAYMYRFASGYLRKEGFEHYEISSYARSGKRSLHNQVYWGYSTEWLAIGLGSTSYFSRNRISRPRAMADYIKWVQHPSTASDWLPANDELSTQSPDWERLSDIVMTRLRTSDGLDLDWVRTSYGVTSVESILKGAELALDLGLATVDNNILSLNDPQGFLFSNSILSSIFVELPDSNTGG